MDVQSFLYLNDPEFASYFDGYDHNDSINQAFVVVIDHKDHLLDVLGNVPERPASKFGGWN